MKQVLQTIHKWRTVLLIAGLVFLGSGYASIMAQSCPTGWSAVASGTLYPENATGIITSGYLPNVVYGGADGQVAQVSAGSATSNLIIQFNQTLAAGGTLNFVAGAINSTAGGDFFAAFSIDGVSYSNSTRVSIPNGDMALIARSLTAPVAFRYIQITPVPGTAANYDAVSYQGSFCQRPNSLYASCTSGETQTSRVIEGESAAGTTGITPGNVLKGPDGLEVSLTTAAQAIVVKFTKGLSAGDTIRIAGYKYSSTQTGNFQVLTSTDGVTFTALQGTSFTNNPLALQTVSLVAAQPFQYVKVVPSGTSQVKLDAITVMGKVCVATVGSCNLTYTTIAGQSVTGTAYSGSVNDVLTLNGTAAVLVSDVIVNFGQLIQENSDVYLNVAPYGTYPGTFDLSYSPDGIGYIAAGHVVVANGRGFETYRVQIPDAFQYIKLVPFYGVPKVDYIGVGGASCPPCNVSATAAITPVTCATSGGANANGTITLTAFGGGATKVGYSIGPTYTGPAFASATTLTSAPFTVVNNLANPTDDQPYTVRVFGTASCYQDYVVTLSPQLCLTADLSLSVSPASQTGTVSGLQTYEVTLSNAGPDNAPNVKVRVPIPAKRTFMAAQPQQGTYNESTQLWDVGTMAVGSKTMKITVRID